MSLLTPPISYPLHSASTNRGIAPYLQTWQPSLYVDLPRYPISFHGRGSSHLFHSYIVAEPDSSIPTSRDSVWPNFSPALNLINLISQCFRFPVSHMETILSAVTCTEHLSSKQLPKQCTDTPEIHSQNDPHRSPRCHSRRPGKNLLELQTKAPPATRLFYHPDSLRSCFLSRIYHK